jgi:hypothetical protein
MQKFMNPLDKIKIASPCGANWNEMRGDQRRRYCTMCRLNVYNLSGMSRAEAESFLINSEGHVCVQFFRRTDGSIITKDCPVGWARVKRKVSHVGVVVFSLIAGFLGGVFALESLQTLRRFTNYDKVPETFFESKDESISFGIYGAIDNLPQLKIEILKNKE